MTQVEERLGIQWRRRMLARAIDEPHRTSTMLELLFDLCFVVAVAQTAASMHHAASANHFDDVFIGFPFVFFAIWWAWMNFTWFASAYDNDDAIYRLAVMFMMAGVLVIAAGAPRALEQDDWRVLTLGYAIMRVPLAALWMRAAHHEPGPSITQKRYAAGVLIAQLGWISLVALPDVLLAPGFVLMAAFELLIPMFAERAGSTTWHAHHIVERYALFTILVLGESILSATVAIQAALDAPGYTREVIVIAIGGLLIVFSMWWLYFAQDATHYMTHVRERFSGKQAGSFLWAYGHVLVFGSAAAIGAGLVIAVDFATDHSAITQTQTGLMLTVPAAIYLTSLWLIVAPVARRTSWPNLSLPIAAVVVLTFSPLALAPLLTGLVLAVVVVVHIAITASLVAHEHLD